MDDIERWKRVSSERAFEAGEAFKFKPYDHDEERSVGFLDDFSVVVLLNGLEGIQMDPETARQLGLELIEAAAQASLLIQQHHEKRE